MTNRVFVLLALTFALFLAGCRNTTKPTAATATPSLSQSAPAQKLAPAAPTPAPAQAVPGAPIPVTPPGSFSAEQVHGQATKFIVQGHAGQFLRVKVKADSATDPTQSVSAQLLGDSPRFIDAIREGGDCSGNFVYSLPKTGKYEIDFDPAQRQMGIDFSTLASDDPLIDPGIKRDQISINFGSFANGKQLKLKPFGQWEGCEGDWEPTNWALEEGGGVEFRIMQVAGFKEADPGSAKSMEQLEGALRRRGKDASTRDVPYPAFGDAGLGLPGQAKFVEGDGWSWLRWIASYSQDSGCVGFDNLAYVVEGITNDGRFFILMRRGIANTRLTRRLEQQCNSESDMSGIFDREVSAADPASFQPSLDQLDAVIKSLKLKP